MERQLRALRSIRKKSGINGSQPGQRSYGDQDPELVYTLEPGLFGNDQVSGSLSRTAGEAWEAIPSLWGSLDAGSIMNWILYRAILNLKSESVDRDGDGVPDDVEEQEGTDPTDEK